MEEFISLILEINSLLEIYHEKFFKCRKDKKLDSSMNNINSLLDKSTNGEIVDLSKSINIDYENIDSLINSKFELLIIAFICGIKNDKIILKENNLSSKLIFSLELSKDLEEKLRAYDINNISKMQYFDNNNIIKILIFHSIFHHSYEIMNYAFRNNLNGIIEIFIKGFSNSDFNIILTSFNNIEITNFIFYKFSHELIKLEKIINEDINLKTALNEEINQNIINKNSNFLKLELNDSNSEYYVRFDYNLMINNLINRYLFDLKDGDNSIYNAEKIHLLILEYLINSKRRLDSFLINSYEFFNKKKKIDIILKLSRLIEEIIQLNSNYSIFNIFNTFNNFNKFVKESSETNEICELSFIEKNLFISQLNTFSFTQIYFAELYSKSLKNIDNISDYTYLNDSFQINNLSLKDFCFLSLKELIEINEEIVSFIFIEFYSYVESNIDKKYSNNINKLKRKLKFTEKFQNDNNIKDYDLCNIIILFKTLNNSDKEYQIKYILNNKSDIEHIKFLISLMKYYIKCFEHYSMNKNSYFKEIENNNLKNDNNPTINQILYSIFELNNISHITITILFKLITFNVIFETLALEYSTLTIAFIMTYLQLIEKLLNLNREIKFDKNLQDNKNFIFNENFFIIKNTIIDIFSSNISAIIKTSIDEKDNDLKKYIILTIFDHITKIKMSSLNLEKNDEKTNFEKLESISILERSLDSNNLILKFFKEKKYQEEDSIVNESTNLISNYFKNFMFEELNLGDRLKFYKEIDQNKAKFIISTIKSINSYIYSPNDISNKDNPVIDLSKKEDKIKTKYTSIKFKKKYGEFENISKKLFEKNENDKTNFNPTESSFKIEFHEDENDNYSIEDPVNFAIFNLNFDEYLSKFSLVNLGGKDKINQKNESCNQLFKKKNKEEFSDILGINYPETTQNLLDYLRSENDDIFRYSLDILERFTEDPPLDINKNIEELSHFIVILLNEERMNEDKETNIYHNILTNSLVNLITHNYKSMIQILSRRFFNIKPLNDNDNEVFNKVTNEKQSSTNSDIFVNNFSLTKNQNELFNKILNDSFVINDKICNDSYNYYNVSSNRNCITILDKIKKSSENENKVPQKIVKTVNTSIKEKFFIVCTLIKFFEKTDFNFNKNSEIIDILIIPLLNYLKNCKLTYLLETNLEYYSLFNIFFNLLTIINKKMFNNHKSNMLIWEEFQLCRSVIKILKEKIDKVLMNSDFFKSILVWLISFNMYLNTNILKTYPEFLNEFKSIIEVLTFLGDVGKNSDLIIDSNNKILIIDGINSYLKQIDKVRDHDNLFML